MGMLSALIVTTCVGPVLVAALIVIGQTGDMSAAAAALFAMSLGMGAPLLVVGSSAGRWLPRAGAWMDGVKRLFGVLMLGMAAWMLSRIVPSLARCCCSPCRSWRPPSCAGDSAARAGAHRSWARTQRRPCWPHSIPGLVLLVGAGRGAEDPLQPFTPAALSADGWSSVRS